MNELYSYVYIHSSTTANGADKRCVNSGIRYSHVHGQRQPTAADFFISGPLFARAVHISQAKIGPGGPLYTPDQLSRDRAGTA